MNPRKAIITGSTKYKNSPLQYPKEDCDLIANVLLKRCHFEKDDICKILHTEADDDSSFQLRIHDLCSKFDSEKTNSYDLILFYYSGHGVYKSTENMSFLQISDDWYLSIDEVIEMICKVKAKNKYIIIDACQSGGFSLMTPKGKIHRQHTSNSEGVYCMFGTTKTQLAFEPTIKDVIRKKINNSFYSHFIVEALNLKSNYTEETISIKVVDDYATKKTPTYTNFEQIPYTTTQTSGYFPFGFWEEQEEFSDISHWEQINELIEQLSSNQEIEIVNYLFSRIQRLFVNEKEFMLYRDLELLSKLSRPAKDILNEKLGLIKMKYENKPLINGLISSNKSEKLYFLTFLLEQPDIEIDLSLKDNDQHTALYEALHLYNYNSHYIIELLFIRGYKVSNEEENRLYEKFDNPSTRPELLENITIAILCLKLGREDLIKKLPKIERIILGLISFKVNRVIGYRLNLTALANVFLQSHRDFSTIFIRALKIYGHYDTLKIKTSIAKKLEIIKDEMPYQETSFNDLLSIVFPELYSEH